MRPLVINFWSFLRGLGVIPALVQKTDRTALGQLTQDYERFLSSERGLAPATLTSYLPIVRSFLSEQCGSNALRLAICAHRICTALFFVKFHVAVATMRSSPSRHCVLFLRFQRQRGAIKTDLAAALFGVAHWRLSHLPKFLPPDQVERLLQCCNRNTASGQRDYAILLILARLGLGGGEVLAMTSDDLGLGAGRDARS